MDQHTMDRRQSLPFSAGAQGDMAQAIPEEIPHMYVYSMEAICSKRLSVWANRSMAYSAPQLGLVVLRPHPRQLSHTVPLFILG